MKRVIAFVLLLMLAFTSVVFVNADEAKTDKLVIWISYGDGSPVASIYQAAVEEYKQLHPEVDVQFSCMGNDISMALEAAFQDPSIDDFPDIFDGGDDHIISFAQNDLLYDLTEAMQTPSYDDPNVSWKDSFMDAVIDMQLYEGKNIMVPTCFYSVGFFYDQNLFDKYGIAVPQTWDEFKQAAKTLKDNGIAMIACDGTLDSYNRWPFITFAERYVDAKEFYNLCMTGEGSFKDDPGYLQAAKLIEEMYTEGMYQRGFEGSSYPACQAVFAQGMAATHFCGGWLPSEMASITPESMKMGVFPIPALPDEKYPGVTEAWGNANCITKDAKNKQNAIDFLKLFSSKKYAEMYIANNIDTAMKDMPKVEKTAGYGDFVANASAIVKSNNGLSHAGSYTTDVFSPLCTLLVTGKLSAEEFIDQLDAQTKTYYGK